MGFTRGQSATASGGDFRQSLAFARGIKARDHLREEIRNIETRSLKVAQSIGEKEIQHRTFFILIRQPGNCT